MDVPPSEPPHGSPFLMRSTVMYKTRRGHLIVFEGPDDTGKTTQRSRLETNPTLWADPKPFFTHSPSGSLGGWPIMLYKWMEYERDLNNYSRQLIHLACHFELYAEEILPNIQTRAVILDRCWISTLAYLHAHKMTERERSRWFDLVTLPTQNIFPSVVFFFLDSWRKVPDPELVESYKYIHQRLFPEGVIVPPASAPDTTRFILNTLVERGAIEKA